MASFSGFFLFIFSISCLFTKQPLFSLLISYRGSKICHEWIEYCSRWSICCYCWSLDICLCSRFVLQKKTPVVYLLTIYLLYLTLKIFFKISGNFIGPTVGGLLMDNYGFAQTTTIFQITGLCFFCLDIINLCCCNLTKKVARLAAKNTTNRKSSLISNTEIRYDLYQRIA